MNAGQTCVAPDYLIATPGVARRIGDHLADAVREFYGDDPRASTDYGRIVSAAHFDTLSPMLHDGRTVFGGRADPADRYIEPTVIADVPGDSRLLSQEIFGPILPIVTVEDSDEAIRFVRAGDRPLVVYVFSADSSVRRRFLTRTSSGAIGFGVTAAHLAVAALPFGGVGASGNGAYHGERSFTVFSHEKAVLDKPLAPDTMRLVYPPYTQRKDRFIRGLLRKLG
jgi:aldehyde dehydrogenase (NAD+)